MNYFKKVNIFAKILNSIIYIILLSLISCVNNPSKPEEALINMPQKGVIILNEGLWGMDNATFDILDLETNLYIKNAYHKLNNNNKLGDIANDILISGDTIFVCVCTSKYIDMISLKSGKSIKRFFTNGNYYPRRMTKIDNNIYITDLYADCLHKIDLELDTILVDICKVGAAPEYIENDGVNLYIVNSGYGDYKYNNEGAGELYVIDIKTLKLKQNIKIGANPIEVIRDKINNKLYVSYINLPSKQDALGGIVELDISNTIEITKTNEWRCKPTRITHFQNDDLNCLYFLSDDGLQMIDIKLNDNKIKTVITNTNKYERWYGLNVSNDNRYLYLTNARNHTIDGELSIYEISSLTLYQTNPNYITPIKKFTTSINPSEIIFF